MVKTNKDKFNKVVNLGTLIFTWLNGEFVGTDEFGTRYYRSKKRKRFGRAQRWCLYKGGKDASKVPPEWHAWLHYTVDEPLIAGAVTMSDWGKQHQSNLTGTARAYRPAGHHYQGGRRADATGDYEGWVPK